MPTPTRIILLAGAALCGGFIVLLGAGFSRTAEPQEYTSTTTVFWLVAGAVFAAPLWVPAAIPARFPTALKVCRRISAAALLFPTWLFGGIVLHNISRAISGLGATPSALLEGLVLTSVCVLCVFLLVRPDLHHAKRTT